MSEKPDMEHQNEVEVPRMPINEPANVAHSNADVPTEVAGTESAPSIETHVVAAAESEDLKTRAILMQDELGSILNTVKSIKDNCAKLKSENQSLQEYIESLMAKR